MTGQVGAGNKRRVLEKLGVPRGASAKDRKAALELATAQHRRDYELTAADVGRLRQSVFEVVLGLPDHHDAHFGVDRSVFAQCSVLTAALAASEQAAARRHCLMRRRQRPQMSRRGALVLRRQPRTRWRAFLGLRGCDVALLQA